MSTIWTPGGERAVPRPEAESNPPRQTPQASAQGPPGSQPTEEEMQAHMAALQKQLLEAPPGLLIANQCFELAALHLSVRPPNLNEAKVAIDALAAVLEALKGRIGEHETEMAEGLAQLRLAFVQLRAAHLGESQPPQE